VDSAAGAVCPFPGASVAGSSLPTSPAKPYHESRCDAFGGLEIDGAAAAGTIARHDRESLTRSSPGSFA